MQCLYVIDWIRTPISLIRKINMKLIKELWTVSKQGGSFRWTPHTVIRQLESMVLVEAIEPNKGAGIPLLAPANSGQAKHHSGVLFVTEGVEASK